MSDLLPFLLAVGAFAAVGIVAGILIARRIDAWDAAQDAPTDPPEDRAP
jgi:hypothetical protein